MEGMAGTVFVLQELVNSAPSHGRRRIDTPHKVEPMKGMVDTDEEYSRILTPRRNSSYRGNLRLILYGNRLWESRWEISKLTI